MNEHLHHSYCLPFDALRFPALRQFHSSRPCFYANRSKGAGGCISFVQRRPQLQADLSFMHWALQEVHSGLYCYTPKDSLDQAFARIAAQLTQPQGKAIFWRLLQSLVAQVHCGYTRLQLSAAYRAWTCQQPHYYFLFTTTVRQDCLFVAENQNTDPSLQLGAELLAIE